MMAFGGVDLDVGVVVKVHASIDEIRFESNCLEVILQITDAAGDVI